MEITWKIEKHQGLAQTLLLFIVPFLLFIISAVNIYFLSRSTDLLLLVIPMILAVVSLSLLPKMIKAIKDFPETKIFKVDDSGITLYLAEKNNQSVNLSWSQIRQYDITESSATGVNKVLIKTDYEEETMLVPIFPDKLNLLTKTLQDKQIPFGYVRAS